MNNMVYVIMWKYSDGSGSGVVCASTSKPLIEERMAMLSEFGDGMRSFWVTEASFI